MRSAVITAADPVCLCCRSPLYSQSGGINRTNERPSLRTAANASTTQPVPNTLHTQCAQEQASPAIPLAPHARRARQWANGPAGPMGRGTQKPCAGRRDVMNGAWATWAIASLAHMGVGVSALAVVQPRPAVSPPLGLPGAAASLTASDCTLTYRDLGPLNALRLLDSQARRAPGTVHSAACRP